MKTETIKHTPGPWRVESHGIIATEKDLIADCTESDLSDAVIEANAKLISAAPELLEACRAILQADENSQPWKAPRFSDAIALVRSAITKATLTPMAF